MKLHPRLVIVTQVASIVLLGAAAVHRQFIGDTIYVHPAFSGIVVWPFFLLLVLATLNLAFAFVWLVKSDIKTFRIYAVTGLLAALACVAAVLLDAATLLYAS